MDSLATQKYTSVILKFVSLGIVIAAASFWAGAGVDSRPKYRDEQTLVGGTVWSQTLIPIGLVASKLVGEKLEVFVECYFLATGVMLLFATGIVLIIGECFSFMRQVRSQNDGLNDVIQYKYDKKYLGIGLLSILAGFFTLADFIIILIY